MRFLSLGLVPLFIVFGFGALIAFLLTWRVLKNQIEAAREKAKNEDQIEIARLNQRAADYSEIEIKLQQCALDLQDDKIRIAALTQENLRIPELRESLNSTNLELKRTLDQKGQLEIDIATLTANLEAERAKGPEKTALLTREFELLANRILEDKSERFTKQNKENLDVLLEPLTTQLHEFKSKVEEVYDKEGKDRIALTTQVTQLINLNQQLSQDANDLTRALKGSGKTQGVWGEGILARVLEMSGLRKGKEYELRESFTREDGSRAQPDAIVYLPENRHIVMDAKVSITAYTDYSQANSDSEKKAALALHLESMRRHIKELSEKNYHALYDLNSLDFVVMFVPLEPAFMLAISEDANLCEQAWGKNVLLVSPTTSLFVVRTVANLWRQKQAAQSVRELQKKGAEFYDKLVGFVKDLGDVGTRLRQASGSYEAARNKLVEGRGNLILQAEMLRDLGVKPNKDLPTELVESALTEQPFVLPKLIAVAGKEDFGEEPDIEDNDKQPAPDEEIPF